MRNAVLVLLGMLAAAASGQVVQKVIWLPDSADGVLAPSALALDPRHGTVYVAGSDDRWVAAVDAGTGRRKAFIDVGPGVAAMCFDSADNKLYVCTQSGSLVAICCSADTVVARIMFSGGAGSMSLDPVRHRLCVASWSDYGTLTFLDTRADTVVSTMSIWFDTPPTYSPVTGLMYCLSEDVVQILDAGAGTIVRQVQLPRWAGGLWCSPSEDKLYLADEDVGGLMVYDCARDSVIACLPLDSGYVFCIAFDARAHVAYCGTDDANVWKVSTLGDTLLAGGPMSGCDAWQFWLSPEADRLYLAAWGALEVLDLRTGDVSWPDIGSSNVTDILPDRVRDRLWCSDCQNDCLLALDRADSVVVRRRLGSVVTDVQYNSASDRLYCADGSKVCAVDAMSDSLVWSRDCGFAACAIGCDLVTGDVFVGGDSAIVAFDSAGCLRFSQPWDVRITSMFCNSDRSQLFVLDASCYVSMLDSRTGGAVRWVSSGLDGMCYDAAEDKMYFTSSQGPQVLVFDCASDCVAALVDLPAACNQLVWCAARDVVVGGGIGGTLVVLDCRTDEVAACIPGCYDMTSLACDPRPTGRGLVYFLNNYREQLAAVDLDVDSVRAQVGLDDPVATAFDGMDRKLFVLQEGGTVISAFADSSLCAAGSSRLDELTGSRLVWVPRHNKLYVASADEGEIAVIDKSVVDSVNTRPRLTPTWRPTVVRGVLTLPASHRPPISASLLDAAGRTVMVLRAGPNDVSGLSPGVYFVREPSAVSRQPSPVLKVIITR